MYAYLLPVGFLFPSLTVRGLGPALSGCSLVVLNGLHDLKFNSLFRS